MKNLNVSGLTFSVEGIMQVDAELDCVTTRLTRTEIYDLYNWLGDLILDDLAEDERLLNR
jgi:hypothetical protein